MKHRKFSARENYVINLFLNKSPLILVSGILFYLGDDVKDDTYYYYSEYSLKKDTFSLKFKNSRELFIDYLRYKDLFELEKSITFINNFAKNSRFKTIFIYSIGHNYSSIYHNSECILMEELFKILKKFNLEVNIKEDYLSWKVG